MTRKLRDPPKISRLGKSNTINSGRQKPFTFMPCHVQCTDFTNIVSFHANNNHKKWVLVLQIFYLTYILYVMYIINYNMKYYWLYIINFVSFSTIHEVLMETILGWFVTLSSSLEKSLMLWKIEGIRGWDSWVASLFIDINSGKFQEMMRDRETWHAAIHEVAKSWTQLGVWTK